jgi:hypothetical protein
MDLVLNASSKNKMNIFSRSICESDKLSDLYADFIFKIYNFFQIYMQRGGICTLAIFLDFKIIFLG